MSNLIKQRQKRWKDVATKLRRIEVTWHGKSLSRLDHDTFSDAILFNAMILNDLSFRYEGLGVFEEHVEWAQYLCSIDVYVLATFLSEAIFALRKFSSGDAYSYLTRLQNEFGEDLDVFRFFYPMVGALDLFTESPCPHSFYPLYQVLSFVTQDRKSVV